MSSKSEIEETGMKDDELYERSKERHEFEGVASGKIKDRCERKQTMKGREYKKETLEKRRRTCSSNLQKHLDSIRELLNCDEPPRASLKLARDNLNRIKDEFNDAHYEFYEYIDSEEDRQTAYQWFDVQDRVAIELRTKLVDKIYSVEGKAEEEKFKSVLSGSSKRSKKRTPLEGRPGHED